MSKKLLKGFTLIELLIVMAILGVLAVVVLVAINPVQQLARTRDAGRKSGVAQIGRALEAYYTSHSGSYLTQSDTFLTALSASGEISTPPSTISYRSGFTPSACTNSQNKWCYLSANGEAVLYAELESDSERSKCGNSTALFVWGTYDGRGGLVCAPAPAAPGTAQSWNAMQ
jgi:prepilin-type N-terminal cleavage/methylation domain-containing protein